MGSWSIPGLADADADFASNSPLVFVWKVSLGVEWEWNLPEITVGQLIRKSGSNDFFSLSLSRSMLVLFSGFEMFICV